MDNFAGVQRWTPNELREKETAGDLAPKHIVKFVKGHLPGEYEAQFSDYLAETEKISYYTAALNAITGWLNFPDKLRPLLDALIGLAGDEGNKEFTATDLELGLQMRMGKAAKSDSIKKFFARHKKALKIWQSAKSFELVRITSGAFDPVRRRNDPTRYQVHITHWMAETVNRAQTVYASDWKTRRLKLKAIRKAAKDVLYSLPECPPLGGHKTKSLSEEEKLDRRVHLQISSHIRNLDFLSGLGMATEELHAYVIHQLNKAYAQNRGLGKLLTPTEDEARTHEPVWARLKNGSLLDEHPIELDDLEDVSAIIPRHWKDGKFVSVSEGHFSEKASDNLQNESDSACKSLNLKSHEGTFLTQNASEGHFGASASDNLQNMANDACKSLNLKSHEGTFLTSAGGTFCDPELTDQKTVTGEIGDRPPSIAELESILRKWRRKLKKKLPNDNKGWQIYWDEMFSSGAIIADHHLEIVIEKISEGTAPLADLKPAFIEHVIPRTSYVRNGVPAPKSIDRLNSFRTRLNDFLQLPGEISSG